MINDNEQMNNSRITSVSDADFEALYAIERAAHPMPWSLGTLKNNVGERYLNLKLRLNERIVGFAVCHIVLDEATLFNIAVHPDVQGRQLGFQLLRELMERLRTKGVVTLWLEVRESNRRAIRLYEKMNFHQVDIRQNYYPTPDGKRENAVIMAAYL